MPEDGAARQAVKPVICYPVESLPKPDMAALKTLRQLAVKSDEVILHRAMPAVLMRRWARFFAFPLSKARRLVI